MTALSSLSRSWLWVGVLLDWVVMTCSICLDRSGHRLPRVEGRRVGDRSFAALFPWEQLQDVAIRRRHSHNALKMKDYVNKCGLTDRQLSGYREHLVPFCPHANGAASSLRRPALQFVAALQHPNTPDTA